MGRSREKEFFRRRVGGKKEGRGEYGEGGVGCEKKRTKRGR